MIKKALAVLVRNVGKCDSPKKAFRNRLFLYVPAGMLGMALLSASGEPAGLIGHAITATTAAGGGVVGGLIALTITEAQYGYVGPESGEN